MTPETDSAQLPEPAETDSAESAETAAPADISDAGSADDFAERVAERIRISRCAHTLLRPVMTPREQSRAREVDQQAAVWVPVTTFAVTAVCAVVVVLIATREAAAPRSRVAELAVAVVTAGFFLAGFATLGRSQAYFDRVRPSGRPVRYDVAEAYETVRDAPRAFVELGAPPETLARVADLLPQADRLVDLLVAAGPAARTHPAYEDLLRMGAEVTVLTELAEERLGRRPARRRQPDRFETLADLAEMIGTPGPLPLPRSESL